MDNLDGLSWLGGDWDHICLYDLLKGTSLIGAVKEVSLQLWNLFQQFSFLFIIMDEHFFAIDFIGMAMILPYSSLDFPQGFHDSKEKASCKIKTNHILVKG